MITHDRYFLERVTDKICEIENGRLITYEGNYDKYLQMKAERQEMALASERKRAAIYKKELRWIRKLHSVTQGILIFSTHVQFKCR